VTPGVPPGPGTTTEFPEGCTVTPEGIISCPTPPTFDVCAEFPELCQQPEQMFQETMEQIEQPFQPPVELPGGFVGGGVSFEGGTIFQRDPCFMTLNEIIEAGLARSASAAANLKAIACSENVTQEPSDFPESFDFGTNVPGPTPESEAQRAACTSCELFGLNCGICSGAEFA